MTMPPKVIVKSYTRRDGRVVKYAYVYCWHSTYKCYRRHAKFDFMQGHKVKMTRVGIF